jgi:uncharacterized membrane protein YgcG
VRPHPSPLRRRFRERNAAIATFDHAGSTSAFSRTIASQFVEQQLARMRGGAAEEAAYAGARSWMLSEGPRLFAGLRLPEAVRAAATATPASVAAARAAADAALAQQLADVREAFAAEADAAGAGDGGSSGGGGSGGGGSGGGSGSAAEFSGGGGSSAARARAADVRRAAAGWRTFPTSADGAARAKALAAVAARGWSQEPLLPRAPDGAKK